MANDTEAAGNGQDDDQLRAVRELRLSKDQASLYQAEWKAIRRLGFPDDADYYSGFSKLLGWPALVQRHDLDRFEDFEDAQLFLQVDDYCTAKTLNTGAREGRCITSWRNRLCRSRISPHVSSKFSSPEQGRLGP
jgi:hypothetical protein